MSDFQFDVEEVNNIIVFRTTGYINNIAAEKIADTSYEYIEKGFNKFLINMENSKIINSIGISIFLEIIERLQDTKGEIAFCNLVSIVKKTFRIMGLQEYSKIYDSEEEAVKAMK